MKILVLGGNGMLGHYFLDILCARHDVIATFRGVKADYPQVLSRFNGSIVENLDVLDITRLSAVMAQHLPDVVINSTGLTKQKTGKNFVQEAIQINALFPHKLAELCSLHSSKLVQFSSDCVFDGSTGGYVESDDTNATDVYGKTKALGEIIAPHVITLRKSTIGLEIGHEHGLIEWFLAQSGQIKGFDGAIYSGLISAELVRLVERILTEHDDFSGLWHVASQPISKYELLNKLNHRLGQNSPKIARDITFECDRSLDSSSFDRATGYKAPTWNKMIDDLALEIEARY